MRACVAIFFVVTGAAGAVQACDLELEPYVDPVKDGGGLVEVPDGSPSDARVDDDGRPTADAAADAPSIDGGDGGVVKRVFVTSTTINGVIGGVAGADARCQQLALNLGGNFRAWISVATEPAATHIEGDGPWFLADKKTRVFANRLAVITTGPEVAIDVDEKGTKIAGVTNVWTGTEANGTPSPQNCTNFTVAGVVAGRVGKADEKQAAWTQSANMPCAQQLRLYCFEQ